LLFIIVNTITGNNIDKYIKEYSELYNLDFYFIKAQIYVESRFKPTATSKVGAKGLGQFMPNTFITLGFDIEDIYDPETSIHALCKYMNILRNKKLLQDRIVKSDIYLIALKAYNGGLLQQHRVIQILDSECFKNKYTYIEHQLYHPKIIKRFKYHKWAVKENISYPKKILYYYTYYKYFK